MHSNALYISAAQQELNHVGMPPPTGEEKRSSLHPNLWLYPIRSFTWIFCVSRETNLSDQRLHSLHWTTYHSNLETKIKLVGAARGHSKILTLVYNQLRLFRKQIDVEISV